MRETNCIRRTRTKREIKQTRERGAGGGGKKAELSEQVSVARATYATEGEQRERQGTETEKQRVAGGWTRSHVRALSLRRNHNAGDALHKNVIRTQIAAFACGPPPPSRLSLSVSFPPPPSRQIGDYFPKLRNQIAIKTPANIPADIFARYSRRLRHSLLAADVRGKCREKYSGDEVG